MSDGLRLFSSGDDDVNYVWDLQPDGATEPRSGDELWNDLSGEGAAAYRAMWQLAQLPDDSVPLLERKLQQIETLVDLQAALKGLDGEAALRRRELARKMIAKNETLVFDATIRRGVEALRRVHSPAAREALTRLAADAKCPAVRDLATESLGQWD